MSAEPEHAETKAKTKVNLKYVFTRAIRIPSHC